MIGADALISALAAHGVDVLFHLPGVETLPVTERARAGSAVRPVMVAHEQAAAFGAFGYGRVSGRPGVCMTVPGPGATNLITGIAAAKADQVPVVAVTTVLPTHLIGRGAAHDCDVATLFVSLVKAQITADSPEDVGSAMDRALRLSVTAPRGPVQIMLTGAVLAASVTAQMTGIFVSFDDALDSDALQVLADRLRLARLPVIYAGRAVIDAGAVEDVQRLAERLGALVFTDESARGIMDERHPQSIGTASHRGADTMLAEGDICVAIGARFSQWSTRDWSIGLPEPIYRIDEWAAPDSPKYEIAGRIVGDIGACLRAVCDVLGPGSPPPHLPLDRGAVAGGDGAGPTAKLIHPTTALRAIRAAMPEDAIAVVDGSSTGTWAAEDTFPVYRPHGFLTPEVLKELGSAIMVGMGAKLAAPARPVVVIQGDGGFLFQVGELSTLMRESIPLCIVIFNDGYYNADRLLLEHMFQGDPTGCALHNPDFVTLAQSFGLDAVRADTSTAIEEAVAAAIRLGRPTLIDVPIDPVPAPYRLQSVFDRLKQV